MEINKLDDLNVLRTAPKLSKIQAKKILEEHPFTGSLSKSTS